LLLGRCGLRPVYAQQTVAINTVTQTAYAAASCAGGAPAAVIINNRGQSVHYLLYQTAGTVTALSIEIQGRNDTTQDWVTISNISAATGSGALFANVYLNFIRIFITTCTGSGSITATYSGTSIAGNPELGVFGLGLDSFTRCSEQAVIQFTAGGAGATRIVTAAGGGKQVLICHISVSSTAAVDLTIQNGTGTNCGTGTASLTGAYENIVTIALDFGYWAALRVPANNDVCLSVDAASTVGGVIVYAEL